MLTVNPAWRFDTPGPIPHEAFRQVDNLVGLVVAQGSDRKRMLEHFKSHFAGVYGHTPGWSSDVGWAQTDLDSAMNRAADNAPLFIAAFYDACEALRDEPGIALPDVDRINRALHEGQAGYQIRLPNLIATQAQEPIAVPVRSASLSEQAHATIQKSLDSAERFLADGYARPAVQELFWLLETVSTAFRGLETSEGTIEGKYFNEIARNLRNHHKGQVLDQVLGWLNTLHGFLSSPTGGKVRHGADLQAQVDLGPSEARLFCDLARSYISYLMREHERISSSQ